MRGRPEGGRRRPPAPTRREALRGTRRELEAAGIEAARAEAERLVAHALGVDRAELVAAGARPLSPAEGGRLARVLRRRLEGEPLQHIEGTAAFRDLVLVADRRALVPRPETEQLVDLVAGWIGERAPLASALDVGTGSGAIALALVTEGLVRRCVGLDVSAEALEQAAENRARLELGERAYELRRVRGGSWWTALGAEERFPLIVSNPPYVADEEMEALPPEVGEREPRVALAGGPGGLDVLRGLAERAAACLEPGGALFTEIGAGQGDAVRELFGGAGWGDVRVERDLAGRERFVRALPPSRPT